MKQTLTDQEIKTLAAIIESCTQRGAFRAAELVPVGNLFNRLISLIEKPKDTDGDNKELPEKT